MTYYLATKNMKKLAELQRILGPAGIDVICEKDLKEPLEDVEETGTTFEENALLKATAAAKALNMPAIADDSGLAVDALDGRPGVYSARFAGEHGDDEKNIDLLLELLKDVPAEKRTARFVSAVACVYPDGRCFTVRGTCEGSIGYERMGNGGFGYDPVFMTELGSFGEISAEQKDSISHRGRALRLLKDRLVSKKLLVFGGTFDPVHLGHEKMLRLALAKCGAEKALVIPTALPPHKEQKSQSTAQQRLEMCETAFGGIEGVTVSDMEISRGGKSYTADTLDILKEQYPDSELLLLCGGDMFNTLSCWVRYESIIKTATIVGINRPGYGGGTDNALKNLWNDNARVELLEADMPDISSTAVREAIANGRGITHMVSEPVAEYIEKNRLYK